MLINFPGMVTTMLTLRSLFEGALSGMLQPLLSSRTEIYTYSVTYRISDPAEQGTGNKLKAIRSHGALGHF
jgi:hypothetical protein